MYILSIQSNRVEKSLLIYMGKLFLIFLILTDFCLQSANAAKNSDEENFTYSLIDEDESIEEETEKKPQREKVTAIHSEYQKIQVLLKKKNWSDAAIALRTFLKDKRNSRVWQQAHFDLAMAYTYLGRREEALRTLRRLGTSKDVVRRVRVLSRLMRTDETAKIFQEGMNFLSARKYKLAFDRFSEAQEREPYNVEVILRKSQCLIIESRFDSAAELLKTAKRLNPYEPEIRLWLGRAFYFRGELKKAVEELRLAYEHLRKSELAPVWLAEALVPVEGRMKAFEILEDDLKREPMHVRSLLALAELKTRARKLQRKSKVQSLWQAKKNLQIALSRYPKYVDLNESFFEGPLGLSLYSRKETKADVESLMTEIESRLEESTIPATSETS